MVGLLNKLYFGKIQFVIVEKIYFKVKSRKIVDSFFRQCISHTTVNNIHAEIVKRDTQKKGGRPSKLTAINKRGLVRAIISGKANTATQLVKELKDSTKIEISADMALKEGSTP